MDLKLAKKGAVDALVKLGLTLGEAKTYVTLFEKGRMGASDLASFAEVSQPKVYSYLKSLENSGYIVKLAIEGKPNYYQAIGYDNVIKSLQQIIDNSVSNSVNFFQFTDENREKKDKLPDFIKVYQGAKAVNNGIAEIINRAEKNLTIIPNEYYNDPVNRLIENKNKKIDIDNYGEIVLNILSTLPIGFSNRSRFEKILKKTRPYIIFTDADYEAVTAKSANFIIPPVDGMDPLILHFTHPVIVNIQFGMISSIFDLIKNSQLIK